MKNSQFSTMECPCACPKNLLLVNEWLPHMKLRVLYAQHLNSIMRFDRANMYIKFGRKNGIKLFWHLISVMIQEKLGRGFGKMQVNGPEG